MQHATFAAKCKTIINNEVLCSVGEPSARRRQLSIKIPNYAHTHTDAHGCTQVHLPRFLTHHTGTFLLCWRSLCWRQKWVKLIKTAFPEIICLSWQSGLLFLGLGLLLAWILAKLCAWNHWDNQLMIPWRWSLRTERWSCKLIAAILQKSFWYC